MGRLCPCMKLAKHYMMPTCMTEVEGLMPVMKREEWLKLSPRDKLGFVEKGYPEFD